MLGMIGLNKTLVHSAFLLCVCTEFLLIVLVASQIPLGSKLSVEDNKFWLSSNGDFALGFFKSDQPNLYSLGIRFNSKSIPKSKQTVVWVAGADAMVSNMSYFQLKEDGDLVLFDSLKGSVVWSSGSGQFSVDLAVLYDSGNLVLLNGKKEVVWQSFDTPIDTLLPGQTFPVSKTLRAATRNSVSSYYSLKLNSSGRLQLRWESNVVYWDSGNPSHANLSVLLSSNGSLRLFDPKMVSYWSVFAEDHGPVNFRFLRIDVDGNLRLYSWIEDEHSWRIVWQAVKNQCHVFGTCDGRGICVFNDSGSPTCKCPFDSSTKSVMKCLFSLPSKCNSGSTMLEYEHTYLYGVYPPNDTIVRTSLQQCKRICLNDPFCTAVTFTNDGSAKCLMKATEYVSGYSDPSLLAVSFVKKCLDPVAGDPKIPSSSSPRSTLREPHRLCKSCLTGAATGTLFTFVVIHIGFVIYVSRRRLSARKKAALAFKDPNSNSFFMLAFDEIEKITENFKQQIGPRMFKGVLQNKQLVLVKDMGSAVEERKFRAAALKLGSIHHKNLLKLKGYCCETGHRLLVYEYAKKGPLNRCLEDPKRRKGLSWMKRMEICSSVARAICYLHTECREFVSHGNLNCENVVLDEYFEAKVTEYGLGMLCDATSSRNFSAEQDVEDFGKFVLTLTSGCQNVEDVIEWAYNEWINGQSEGVLDERIDTHVDSEELERILRIAFWCLQSDDRLRPPMGEVVKVLEGTLPVDPPPPPFARKQPLGEEQSLESGSES